MQLGASYEAQGLFESAAREYESALRRKQEYIPARMALGNLAFAAGDLKKSAARYREVLRLDADHAGANNNLAMVCLARGKDMDKAERYLRTALKQQGPLRPYVLETLAVLRLRQGRFSEAEEALDEADGLAPPDNSDLLARLIETRRELMGLMNGS
jgi:tetratricopeptide (TPR) repeat protein